MSPHVSDPSPEVPVVGSLYARVRVLPRSPVVGRESRQSPKVGGLTPFVQTRSPGVTHPKSILGVRPLVPPTVQGHSWDTHPRSSPLPTSADRGGVGGPLATWTRSEVGETGAVPTTGPVAPSSSVGRPGDPTEADSLRPSPLPGRTRPSRYPSPSQWTQPYVRRSPGLSRTKGGLRCEEQAGRFCSGTDRSLTGGTCLPRDPSVP